MIGYYNMPEATAEAIDADGWLHTGDLALREPNGYYRITGRLKDMIIRGGENIYPREIEELLFKHPAVASVQVVGVPDRRLGEEVLAWVKLKSGQHSDGRRALRLLPLARWPTSKRRGTGSSSTASRRPSPAKSRSSKSANRRLKNLGLQDVAKIETA